MCLRVIKINIDQLNNITIFSILFKYIFSVFDGNQNQHISTFNDTVIFIVLFKHIFNIFNGNQNLNSK